MASRITAFGTVLLLLAPATSPCVALSAEVMGDQARPERTQRTAAPIERGDSLVDFLITMDGDQETNAVATAAFGAGTASLDLATNTFSWDFSFEGLSSGQIGAHFHGPAMECEPGGVQIGLPLGQVQIDQQVVSEEQAADILAGLWYVNIHSIDHPGGEIRGQVMPMPVDDPIPAPIGPGDLTVQLELVCDGMTAPNWGTYAPGHPDRLFVTDQDGVLWNVNLTTGEKTEFLDVSPLLVDLGLFGPGSFDERGLLGVALHPQYEDNGLLYTYTSEPVFKPADFSTMPPGVLANHRSVIREWGVHEPGDPDAVVDPTTSRVLMRIDQPQFNHNAGALNFGHDGYLYIAFGDGGGADDKDGQPGLGGPMVGHGCIGNGQDVTTILGSVIRIDPLGDNAANGQYGIPEDNPFAGRGDALAEIYAYGFRNPFRFSFDQVSGALYLADVGQNHLEEINVVEAGGNYGWKLREGSLDFVPNGNASGYAAVAELAGREGVIDPIAEYDHDEGIAVLGGFVSRGSAVPQLDGTYVFGEFATTFSNDGRLFHLADGGEIVEFGLDGLDAFGMSMLGLGQDAGGDVYVLANMTGTPFGETGVVLRIRRKAGDADANGMVNVADLLAVINGWGPCPDGDAVRGEATPCVGDLNGDGQINVTDLLAVINNWGS